MSAIIDPQVFGSVFVTLLVIMDPPGALPIFLALTGSLTQKQKVAAARRASLVALGVIAAFAVFGQYILSYLHISLPALQGAGGLLLLIVALQLLTGLVVNPQGHDSDQYYRVTLDVSNYRTRREETLTRLATHLADKALETGAKQELEPMNSYERRIIHTALQGIDGITTWSEGDDPYRHVIIAPNLDDDALPEEDEE